VKRLIGRAGFTLIELLVVLAIIGLLIGLTLPAVQRVRASAARIQCANNLRQIALALHNYDDVQQSLPAGVSFKNGKDPYPWMSWLTRLLPYMEQPGLWEQAERAFAQDKWFENDPPHAGLATVVRAYSCPADPRTSQVFLAAGKLRVAFTAYLGVEGKNQLKKDGVLYLDSRVRLSDIKDGLSNTLMIGERPPSPDGRLGWWYAGWGQSQDGSAEMVLGVRERGVTYDCPPTASHFGPGSLTNNCDVLHFWSLHLGNGANFAFADGSVHFLPYSADSILPALATRAGGESVQPP
jgi:prepilin-type N-terminal cleavage/methylation domain-containing protein/prepilin-type processing-associated H-X9-DG protein